MFHSKEHYTIFQPALDSEYKAGVLLETVVCGVFYIIGRQDHKILKLILLIDGGCKF